MPLIAYREITFRQRALRLIGYANEILEEYAAQGFTLTLRQLYYQFVARDLIPNTLKSYKNLGAVVNDARLAGLIDWDSIVDRTRGVRRLAHWGTPQNALDAVTAQYHEDLWRTQPRRVEVWIEKDALVGVIEPTCVELDVPFLSCRGYTSQSEMWGAAMRLLRNWDEHGQEPHIVHLGDHDPSGNDMTRDIEERLLMFLGGRRPVVHRIALNRDQVRRYKCPPNPAKVTDSRAGAYIREHGRQSWELDALEPSVIAELIRSTVLELRDEEAWAQAIDHQEKNRRRLQAVEL